MAVQEHNSSPVEFILNGCQILAVLMLLVAATLGAEPRNTSHVNFVVYDISSDRPVARSMVEVAVNSDCASGQEMLRFSAATGEHDEFEASLPIGEHLLSVTAPPSSVVKHCVDVSSAEWIKRCTHNLYKGWDSRQTVIVRTVGQSSKYRGDILSFHPCQQAAPNVCSRLGLPHNISSKYVIFADEEKRPIANAILEFREYGMGFGSTIVASVTTNSEGGADLGPVYVSQETKRYPASQYWITLNGSSPLQGFLLDLSAAPSNSQQRVKILKWRCHGEEQLEATTE